MGDAAGVTLLGALPVGLLVRDHALVAAFSTASVGFIMLFATVIVVFSLLPAYSIGERLIGEEAGLDTKSPSYDLLL